MSQAALHWEQQCKVVASGLPIMISAFDHVSFQFARLPTQTAWHGGELEGLVGCIWATASSATHRDSSPHQHRTLVRLPFRNRRLDHAGSCRPHMIRSVGHNRQQLPQMGSFASFGIPTCHILHQGSQGNWAAVLILFIFASHGNATKAFLWIMLCQFSIAEAIWHLNATSLTMSSDRLAHAQSVNV